MRRILATSAGRRVSPPDLTAMPHAAARQAALSRFESRARLFGTACALGALAVVGSTVAGFAATNDDLLVWIHGDRTIPVTGALGLGALAAGLLLWVSGGDRGRRWQLGLSIGAVSIGVAATIECAGIGPGAARLIDLSPAGPNARASMGSAVVLVALGCAAALLPRTSRLSRVSMHVLAVMAASMTLVGLVGYAVGMAPDFTLHGSGSVPSFPALLAGLLIALALLALRCDVGLTRIMVAPGPGGRVARVIVPCAVAVPIAGAAVAQAGRSAGAFDGPFGLWIVAVLSCVLFGFVALEVSNRLEALGVARAKAASELAASLARATALFEGARDAIFESTFDGTLLAANPATERMVGLTKSELLRTNLFDLIAPEASTSDRATLARRLAADEVEPTVVRIVARDGRTAVAELHGRVSEADGEAPRLQVIARDVTERRALEAQLLQSQKLESVGLLAGGVAHDFNNLLTVIAGYSALLLAEREERSPLAEQGLVAIQGAAARAAAVTAKLLAFTRKSTEFTTVAAVAAVVGSALDLVEPLVGERIRVERRLDPDVGQVAVDVTHLEQVIVNLVVNARDAIEGSGTITVVTRSVELGDEDIEDLSRGTYAAISVADDGCGMNDATAARIFEPFFTTKPPGQGTGLGLSSAHGMITKSGGQIAVESRPGEGTTFTIYLPRTGLSVARTQATAGPTVTAVGQVLLVEDEDVVRTVVATMLITQGCTVIEAGGGDEALRCLAEGRFDLMVTDTVMPGFDGHALAVAAVAAQPGLPVLFISGYAPPTESQRAFQHSRTAFLAKPFTTDQLARSVHDLLHPATPA